jgi:serine/threonine protein kinase
VHRDIKPHNILFSLSHSHLSQDSDKDDESILQNHGSTSGSGMRCLKEMKNYVLKISDMGLSKQLGKDEHSFSSFSYIFSNHNQHPDLTHNENDPASHYSGQPRHHHSVVGTIGWQAPEIIQASRKKSTTAVSSGSTLFPVVLSDDVQPVAKSDVHLDIDKLHEPEQSSELPTIELSEEQLSNRRTLNVDVFSLGCVYYYTLTLGKHPFGEWYEREANIVNNRMNLSDLERFPDAYDLISSMIHCDTSCRPSSRQVCNHPFFWPSCRRLEFLTDFSDRLEKEQPEALLLLELERSSYQIIYGKWDKRLDPELVHDFGKYRKYDTSSVRDLLRLIRNKKHHFHELSVSLKEKMGSVPAGFYSYFDVKFPHLLMHCAKVANTFLREEAFIANWRNDHPSSSKASLTAMNAGLDTPVTVQATLFRQNDPSTVLEFPVSLITSPAASSRDTSVRQMTNEEIAVTFIDDVIVWNGSNLQTSLGVKGWWRDHHDWMNSTGIVSGGSKSSKKNRPSHLTKAATDLKYRTRLCTHYEATAGASCPMRKKGKCIFAHSPLELRVKDTRRDKWGKTFILSSCSASELLFHSGGEDVLNAARVIEKVRAVEGSYSEFERSSNPPPVPLSIPTSTSSYSSGANVMNYHHPEDSSYHYPEDSTYHSSYSPVPSRSLPSHSYHIPPSNYQLVQDPQTGLYYYLHSDNRFS